MHPSDNSLQGRVALVTGAGKGIGRAIALAYARAGAAVCCAGRTESDVVALADDIRATGGQAMAAAVDVTQETDVDRMVASCLEAFGRLDIVVLNAGVAAEGASVEASDAQRWRQTLDVNLFGAYLCARAAIPGLKAAGGGKVIMIGSGLGHTGQPGISDYACAKAGLWMLTRVLAQELAPHQIDVNELIPGPVDTAMTATAVAQSHLQANPALQQEWLKQPEDVVPLALFLATQPPRGPTAQSFGLGRRPI
ncbi:SDR family NAD(P)-dependent oxidoreductase [Hydrogenophaga sp. 2FB]|uniref:SDR family NAD(P)-dependent oxidoreductase n=1 Tax=Hydrogenophaga sp. 2FB TaxID=2502187 RepID=UPI0010F83BD5|nr:SDR family NAD(P)-dependent oxidoreductase [Hydrogenophaga sp. 2FB]